MKQSIKEFQEGKTYFLLETDINRTENFKIYKALLKELFVNERIAMATFIITVNGEDIEIYFHKPVQNKYVKDMSNDLLETPIILSTDHDNGEYRKMLYNTGFMLSDSPENCINEYEEFLHKSLDKMETNIKETFAHGNYAQGKGMEVQMAIMKETYLKQIIWMRKNIK